MGEELFHLLGQVKRSDDQIDQFDSNKRNDETAEAVDQQVALQDRERAHRFVSDAAQRQRNSAIMTSALKMTALRIALVEVLKCMMLSGAIAGNCAHQHRGNNREVFRYIVRDTERRQ
jgi:hypothetical protein